MIKRLLFILAMLPGALLAQDSSRTGVKYGFLPVLSFNTDDGIFLGGELKRYDYRDIIPFKSYTRIAANYKTNGAFALGVYRDDVRFLGADIRANYDAFSTQNFADYFFGDTNELGFDKERFDSTSYYSFKSFRVNVGGIIRIPIQFGEGIERMDFKTGIRFVYETPWGTPDDRFIYEGGIEGRDGAFLTLIDLGFVMEHRNAEFRAQRGYMIDLGTKYAPPGVSTHHTVENYFTALGFIPLLEKTPVTLATRFNFRNTLGDTPYWFTPFLGGGNSMRGYMYRRFTSDNSIFYTIELRSWLIKLPYRDIELGMNIFADGGRVFSNKNWGSIFQNHNLTLGFGGVMSIFTPDYILKYDIGFSEDGVGIYLGTGYSF